MIYASAKSAQMKAFTNSNIYSNWQLWFVSARSMAVSLDAACRGGIAPPQGGVSIISLRDGIKLLKHVNLSGTVAEVHVFDDSNQVLLVGGGERVRELTLRCETPTPD